MSFFKIFCAAIILAASFTAQSAFSKDRDYKFNFKGHTSKKISDQDDFAMLKAAEYTLKKKYEFFVIEDTRRYERKAKDSGGLGSRKVAKPTPKTELKIHVYDAESTVDGAFDAKAVKQEIDQKYSG